MMKTMEHNQPVGIVISQGTTTPGATTARLAYVWGPAPELEIESDRIAPRAA